ncbi:MAG: hypothetical protein ACRD12_00265 [Acidimicrobiales bacterium]
MKRRTLDLLFSIGGLGIAGLLVILGVVLTSNANFSDDYVTRQLKAQRITFPVAEKLKPEEQESACVVRYAGQMVTTGKQAECYANEFIGLHVQNAAGGKTYAELGDVQTSLRAKIAEAQRSNDPGVADLQKQLADATSQRETVFKGETLRGILLTSYGFSELGAKGAEMATVTFVAAGLMLVLSIAGFVHFFVTPRSQAFAAVEPDRPREREAVSVA